jgi:hypothetical protein
MKKPKMLNSKDYYVKIDLSIETPFLTVNKGFEPSTRAHFISTLTGGVQGQTSQCALDTNGILVEAHNTCK